MKKIILALAIFFILCSFGIVYAQGRGAIAISETGGTRYYATELEWPVGSTTDMGNRKWRLNFNIAGGWTYTDPNNVSMTDPNDVLHIGNHVTIIGSTGAIATDSTVSANGAVLTGDTNTLDITSGTGSLNVASGKTIDFDMDFKVDGTGTTITGADQANTITLNESLTIGGGFNLTLTAEGAAGSMILDKQTFEVAGEGTATQLTTIANANNAAATLTIEGTDAIVNQDTTSDATVTFGTVNGLTITNTANNIDIDKGSAELDIAASAVVNIDKSLTVDGQAVTITGVTQANTITLNESLTIGGGFNFTLTAEDTAGSITLDEQTFEVEGQGDNTRLTKLVNANDAAATLTIEGTSGVINQDLTTDGTPSFATVSTDASATPTVNLTDSDQDDSDVTAKIYANATTTGTGAEVADMYFQTQGAQGTAGTIQTFAHFDGSAQTFSLIGGQKRSRTASATDYNPSAATNDYIIAITNTDVARAVTISTEDRDTGSTADPRIFIIKDESGLAGTNNITISLETAGNIDGAGTLVISQNYGAVSIYVDGTNGWIMP